MPDILSRLDEIEKRRERAFKALEVGGIAGAFLCVEPLGTDMPWLIAQLRAALKAKKPCPDGEHEWTPTYTTHECEKCGAQS